MPLLLLPILLAGEEGPGRAEAAGEDQAAGGPAEGEGEETEEQGRSNPPACQVRGARQTEQEQRKSAARFSKAAKSCRIASVCVLVTVMTLIFTYNSSFYLFNMHIGTRRIRR